VVLKAWAASRGNEVEFASVEFARVETFNVGEYPVMLDSDKPWVKVALEYTCMF